MQTKTRSLARTALLLALLIAAQAVTKPLGQLVTGSCVNALLACAALLVGPWAGLAIALVSPVLAFLLGIAPQAVTVPAIMAGNAVYVLLLSRLYGPAPVRQVLALAASAVGKFGVLYLLVAGLICGVLSPTLLEQGVLKAPMLKLLPAMFSWPQLITALIGGSIALVLVPVLKKALKNT